MSDLEHIIIARRADKAFRWLFLLAGVVIGAFGVLINLGFILLAQNLKLH